VADVAHELRNPMAVIQGNLEAILDGVVPLSMEQVASVHSETLLLNRMVEDLRLLSLAEAGQIRLEQRPIPIVTWIGPVVEQWKIPAEEKGVQLAVSVGENIGSVRGDPDRLAQVMNNLITNALRYTPSRGIIAIRVEDLDSTSQLLRFSVTDTGPGIAAADLEHVFERFYQGDHHAPRQVKGSGLGLTIVKYLVEAHGGQVHAESPVFQGEDRPPYGTRIWFTLPQNHPNNQLKKEKEK
jgi:signal transduction histidine kinase